MRTRPGSLAAEALHTAWGTAFDQPTAQGIGATHSVLTSKGTTTRGGEYIYAPTSLSPGGACIEMTTAYTPSGPLLWAWDWCGGRSSVGKAVTMNSACTDMAGQGFDASAIQVELNGAWQSATPANSYSYGNPPPSGSSFQCPKLTFTMNTAYNHWSARIAS